MKPRIALYGWAFDPPQLAHETIAREAIKQLNLDKLYIVPSWPRSDKVYKASQEYRERIMEIFTENINSPKAELSKDFLDWKIKNTTLNTDKLFRQKLGFSPYQIFWSDVIDNMWERDPAGEVALRLPKIIVKRPWFEVDTSKIDNFILLEPFKNSEVADLSSTLIRENIKKRVFDWLNGVLANFIDQNKLYI
jgi:nicotinic acid mononucleotide adenylyltransferase